ncbi:N-acetylglucosaminyl deacetylase, LmbE family [Microbacterium sp. ru370.1]|uniref:PIG-L family deacetylase n=1 Tax=unclassified Microbacterium TaxID=2609290 RepID=UPI0008901E1C|nr:MULTISPECIES: PIG-L family deacetylase [unclassified Microbacterium]SDO27349.1 N-acetylglucosaminyl deacetylase, LmbE family [Microbacterium sp. ru370.1]SIT74704.1 N-acetylglucosaminyl deacetylase, LmbE family [Microbacterium sp. RU1D]
MVSFDHRDPGTAESVWSAALKRHLPPLVLDVDRVVVVAAHPDDETLGAAGLIATAAARGIPVDLLVVTDGEGSHPDSPTHSPATLALARRRELREAASIVGVGSEPVFLGLPDGGTDDHRDAIAAALHDVIDRASADRLLVLSPWRGDGHRDHRVVGEIVEEECAARGVRSRSFPIWLWHWGGSDDVPWERAERLTLDAAARDAKTRALDAHASQLRALSPALGDEPMVHAGMRAHFERDGEVFFAPEPASAASAEPTAREAVASPAPPTVDQGYFDGMYARHDDPWGFDSRWYEERKRAVLLAALPRRHYRAVFEAGCATGALTAALADRAEHVLAVDLASAALERARTRLTGRRGVELRRATLPFEWPEGEFDLIVLSEVAYYWAGDDLHRGLAAAVSSLAADGCLVACHWRHPVAEYPRDGDEVHAGIGARTDLVRLVRHEEEDFLLEVFGRPGARSVAGDAGLIR